MTEADFVLAIKKHSGIIHKILYLYLDDKEEREDMAQEIHLQAWKSISRFREESTFSTWLYRVALNTVFTQKRKKRISLTSLEDHEVTQELVETSDKTERLLLEIKRLSDVDKTIITLHLESYDNSEIAEILGLTKNNVTVKIHRIKENLKQKLNPEYGNA